jgi:hypothetical protein
VGKSEVKDGTLTGPAFCPGVTAVSLDDALDRREADAMAFIFARRMQSLEGAE